MDIKDVMNKLDTYIKGYSKLLEENNLLKERLNMYDAVVETSTISVKNALDKVKKTEMILETYMEKEAFIKRLTELRMSQGVSARDMSLSLGQSESYINKPEEMEMNIEDVEVDYDIIFAFQVSVILHFCQFFCSCSVEHLGRFFC